MFRVFPVFPDVPPTVHDTLMMSLSKKPADFNITNYPFWYQTHFSLFQFSLFSLNAYICPINFFEDEHNTTL